MDSLTSLSDDQVQETLTWALDQIWCLEEYEEDRTKAWYIRHHGYQNMARIFEDEQVRRIYVKNKVERLGELTTESKDPKQLHLF